MKTGQSNMGVSSIWQRIVRDANDNIKHAGKPYPNLRTKSGNDWQAALMEGGVTNAVAAGTASAATSTSLTTTASTFPTAVNITGHAAGSGGLIGQIVAAGPNSAGTGPTLYAVIVANTSRKLIVDRWISPVSPFAQASSSPNATAKFQVLPGNAPGWFLALSTAVITASTNDAVLSGESTAAGFRRASATTITHTAASASYSLAKTFTATATRTINSEAVFNASAGNPAASPVFASSRGGVMIFEASEPSPPTLVSGDTLAQTVTVNY